MLFRARWVSLGLGFPLGSLWVRASGPPLGSWAWGSHWGVSGYGFPLGGLWVRAAGAPLGLLGLEDPLGLRAWVSHRGVSGENYHPS